MIVVGYPNSGNTWACFLLAYCLNAEFDAIDAPGRYPSREDQRPSVKGGLRHRSFEAEVGKVLKTHAMEVNQVDQPVVYVARHGRDVTVSYYYYKSFYLPARRATKHTSPRRALLTLGKSALARVRRQPGEPQSLTQFIQMHAPEWSDHVQTWWSRQPGFVLRYEDLWMDPATTLGQLFAALGTPVGSQVVEKAIELFSFEAQSQRRPGDEQPDSLFRKGVIGDWQTRFTTNDLDTFRRLAGTALDRLGYEADWS